MEGLHLGHYPKLLVRQTADRGHPQEVSVLACLINPKA